MENRIDLERRGQEKNEVWNFIFFCFAFLAPTVLQTSWSSYQIPYFEKYFRETLDCSSKIDALFLVIVKIFLNYYEIKNYPTTGDPLIYQRKIVTSAVSYLLISSICWVKQGI